MPRAISGDVSIAYDDLGKGEPALLLLPGWCANRTVFKNLAPLCGAHRRTLALDWRGHGESGAASEDFGIEELVEDAVSVMEASSAERIVPVALSHAGWVAIELRRRLTDAGSSVPVIFITARDDEATRREAIKAGCAAYLRKPFSGRVLIDAVANATAGSGMRA